MSLQALTHSLRDRGITATCYVCGDDQDQQGASFVADLADAHMVRFRVSAFGLNWVESRNGRELVKLEGADAIQELQRVSVALQNCGEEELVLNSRSSSVQTPVITEI